MIPFIISTLLALLITPLIIKWYRSQNWVDDPQQATHAKKTHTDPVPRGGGIVIGVVLIICSILFLEFDKYLVAILTGAVLLMTVGFLDDIYDIHPLIRLGVGFLAALIVVGSGMGIAYVSNPFGDDVIHLDQPQIQFEFMGESRSIWIVADIFALLFILWNMNIVNWSKGVDGQMPGFVSIALVFIGILSLQFADDPTQFNSMYLAFIGAGAFAGFLYWNWYPQKIMPGYGAGSLAGYLISVLAIVSGAKLATVFMVLSIPTADAVFTILRRLLAKKSPIWGDRGHLHHKLLDVFAWGRRRIAIFYWLITFIMGMLALYLNTAGKLLTIGLASILVFGLLVWAKYQQKYGKIKH